MEKICHSLESLIGYCESAGHMGYDPYDTLISPFLKKLPGTFIPAMFIQIQKKNPLNLRQLIGIRKEKNPKAIGLFLKSYCLLYKFTGNNRYLDNAYSLYNWLNTNHSKGYSGKCWGYNFDWASPNGFLKTFTPSVVVTSFVVDGTYEFYKITRSKEAANLIVSAAKYIKRNIPITEFNEGISFAYSHLSKEACYNASLLAAEVLAREDNIKGTTYNNQLIERAVNFVLYRQKPDGSWFYSLDPKTGRERKQIDFHQGFILVSLWNIFKLTGILTTKLKNAISKGLRFYKEMQFFRNGRARWRLPRNWPVDIHNQSQGILTFSKLKDFDPSYFAFAKIIAEWTIRNMQSKVGYFYYRKTPFFTNKIPYMRWSQAWMMLALATLISSSDFVD